MNLIVAHQYIKQLDEKVAWAVFGNVGTIITFRVGTDDAAFMENEFMPVFTPEDLVNLAKFQVYLKLMVDGASTAPFSANTLSPIAKRTGTTDKIIAVSRERYATPRQVVEEKVLRWSGMELSEAPAGVSYPNIMSEEERETAQTESGTEITGRPELRLSEPSAASAEEHPEAVEYLKMSDERLASLPKPSMEGKKKDKPKFSYTCSRCSKVWDMPIKLDTTRPVYCAECMPLVKEEKKSRGSLAREGVRPRPALEKGSLEDVAPKTETESKLRKMFDDAAPAPRPTDSRGAERRRDDNRPRFTGERRPLPPGPQTGGKVRIVTSSTGDEDGLLASLVKAKGGPIEKNKDTLTT